MLTGKATIRAAEDTIGASRLEFLMLLQRLINFEKHKYYQNKPDFNGVYSRNNLPKIKDGAYVINCDKFKSIGTQYKVLYVNGSNVIII